MHLFELFTSLFFIGVNIFLMTYEYTLSKKNQIYILRSLIVVESYFQHVAVIAIFLRAAVTTRQRLFFLIVVYLFVCFYIQTEILLPLLLPIPLPHSLTPHPLLLQCFSLDTGGLLMDISQPMYIKLQ